MSEETERDDFKPTLVTKQSQFEKELDTALRQAIKKLDKPPKAAQEAINGDGTC